MKIREIDDKHNLDEGIFNTMGNALGSMVPGSIGQRASGRLTQGQVAADLIKNWFQSAGQDPDIAQDAGALQQYMKKASSFLPTVEAPTDMSTEGVKRYITKIAGKNLSASMRNSPDARDWIDRAYADPPEAQQEQPPEQQQQQQEPPPEQQQQQQQEPPPEQQQQQQEPPPEQQQQQQQEPPPEAQSTPTATPTTTTTPTTAQFPGEDPQGPGYVGRREVARRQAARAAQATTTTTPPTADYSRRASGYGSQNITTTPPTTTTTPPTATPEPTPTTTPTAAATTAPPDNRVNKASPDNPNIADQTSYVQGRAGQGANPGQFASFKPETSAMANLSQGMNSVAAPQAAPTTTPTVAPTTAPTTATAQFPGEDPQGPGYVGRKEVARRQAARAAQATASTTAPAPAAAVTAESIDLGEVLWRKMKSRR